jgi:hypothetical protein
MRPHALAALHLAQRQREVPRTHPFQLLRQGFDIKPRNLRRS